MILIIKQKQEQKILNLNQDNTIAIHQMTDKSNIKYYLEKFNLSDPWDIVDLFEKNKLLSR